MLARSYYFASTFVSSMSFGMDLSKLLSLCAKSNTMHIY